MSSVVAYELDESKDFKCSPSFIGGTKSRSMPMSQKPRRTNQPTQFIEISDIILVKKIIRASNSCLTDRDVTTQPTRHR